MCVCVCMHSHLYRYRYLSIGMLSMFKMCNIVILLSGKG